MASPPWSAAVWLLEAGWVGAAYLLICFDYLSVCRADLCRGLLAEYAIIVRSVSVAGCFAGDLVTCDVILAHGFSGVFSVCSLWMIASASWKPCTRPRNHCPRVSSPRLLGGLRVRCGGPDSVQSSRADCMPALYASRRVIILSCLLMVLLSLSVVGISLHCMSWNISCAFPHCALSTSYYLPAFCRGSFCSILFFWQTHTLCIECSVLFCLTYLCRIGRYACLVCMCYTS